MLVLSLTGALFVLGMAVLLQVDSARQRVRQHTQKLRARSLAASGCRYARFMLSSGRWSRELRYQSPDFQGCFRVDVRRLGERRYQVTSQGVSGEQVFVEKANCP